VKFWGAPRAIAARVAGERALAFAALGDDGWLVGTREALHVLTDTDVRVPWETVRAAEWDPDLDALSVSYVDGREPDTFTLSDAGRILQLIRERVTASVVVQRPVRASVARGAIIVARQAPTGGPIEWSVDHRGSVDLSDPSVAAAISDALAHAKAELD